MSYKYSYSVVYLGRALAVVPDERKEKEMWNG